MPKQNCPKTEPMKENVQNAGKRSTDEYLNKNVKQKTKRGKCGKYCKDLQFIWN